MAKTKEERVTLLHMFGLYYDLPKAISSIVKIDPGTKKLDLLLSRYVNIRESNIENAEHNSPPFETLNTQLIDSIALLKNTHLPYFWEICAGYLNYLNSNYAQAENSIIWLSNMRQKEIHCWMHKSRSSIGSSI